MTNSEQWALTANAKHIVKVLSIRLLSRDSRRSIAMRIIINGDQRQCLSVVHWRFLALEIYPLVDIVIIIDRLHIWNRAIDADMQ